MTAMTKTTIPTTTAMTAMALLTTTLIQTLTGTAMALRTVATMATTSIQTMEPTRELEMMVSKSQVTIHMMGTTGTATLETATTLTLETTTITTLESTMMVSQLPNTLTTTATTAGEEVPFRLRSEPPCTHGKP